MAVLISLMPTSPEIAPCFLQVGGAAVESPAAGVAKREEKGKGKVSGVASSKKKKASSRMDKGTSQLFSKWAAVRKEVQDAESGDEDEVSPFETL